MFGMFVCRSEHLNQAQQPHRKEGPGWGIIIGFTIVFLATYPLHMYVAEVYLADDQNSFFFLLLKYCVGFLYLIFVPIVTLSLQKEIRIGIATVFGSAIMCLQNEPDPEQQEHNGGSNHQPILTHQPRSLTIEE